MPSSGREYLGWKIGNKEVGIEAKHRGRTDVVPEFAHGRPVIFLDIAIGGAPAGRILCELYSDAVPKTVENFRSLCTGIRGMGRRGKPLHYRGCSFHRIVPNFVIQGGDITHDDGTGGESIYGTTFPDESLTLKHTVAGILSMANSGKDTNNSQFFICTKTCPHLDGKHTVFGRVVDGMDVVHRVEACGQENGTPTVTVTIDDCGELKGGITASRSTATNLAVAAGDDDLPGRFAKRRRAADLPDQVHILHILKKHAGSKEPTDRKGAPVKATKGRAVLALANMRKRLVMSPDLGSQQRSFVELAREQSDSESHRSGGDLGRVGLGTLDPAVEDVAFSLSVGEVSEPFESPDGVNMLLRIA